MSLALTIVNLVGELNDTMTANNGGTVLVALSDALNGGLGSKGITDREVYHQEMEHIAYKVAPAVKALGHGGGATGNGIVKIAYPDGSVVTFTDMQAFQADFEANFATYYPALAAL